MLTPRRGAVGLAWGNPLMLAAKGNMSELMGGCEISGQLGQVIEVSSRFIATKFLAIHSEHKRP